jgi:hypothetical protein
MATDVDPNAPERGGSPPLEGGGGGRLRGLLRAYVEREPLRYVLSAAIVLAVMLLVPDLLNNMLLTLVVLLAGVAILPEALRRRL